MVFAVSPCLPSLVSLSTCLPAWLWTASGVCLSRCLSSLEWLHLFPAMASGLSILGGVVWLSGCLSLRVFLHVSPILAGGVRCPDVFSLLSLGCHHFSLPFVSRFIRLPTHVSSVISLPYSGGVWFFPCFSQSVSQFICLPIHMSPLVAVSCSCFIAISSVIGPYPCSVLPLCLVVVSAVAPAQTPDSNKMKKGFL